MNIVTIGGGTGTFTVLSGLKKYPVDLTAIVSMADDGGSTGRLRDEFGILPVGDIRMALVALAENEFLHPIIRELFLYRFEKGEGLKGHNFGNLFLVALSEILGDSAKAVQVASEVLRIKGKVIPITNNPVSLVAEYSDGTKRTGQSLIDSQPEYQRHLPRITHLTIDPISKISASAKNTIQTADCIILGPGDLYTSIFADLVVNGTQERIKQNKGKLIYILNLMTKLGQTHGMTAKDHVGIVADYAGRLPDVVIYNTAPIPPQIVRKYIRAHEHPVKINFLENEPYKTVGKDIIKTQEFTKPSSDVIRRSLIRHDPDKLAKVIMSVLSN